MSFSFKRAALARGLTREKMRKFIDIGPVMMMMSLER